MHPEGGGRMRTEGGAFSGVRWLAEPDLPLGLCQVQLLPDSCVSVRNLSLIQSRWQQQLFAPSARPRCARRPPLLRILGGKRKSKVKIMFCSDIKLEKLIIQEPCKRRAGRWRETFFHAREGPAHFPHANEKCEQKKGKQMLVDG